MTELRRMGLTVAAIGLPVYWLAVTLAAGQLKSMLCVRRPDRRR
jgi:hypothetical protein